MRLLQLRDALLLCWLIYILMLVLFSVSLTSVFNKPVITPL